ncbi:TolC family protein [Aurantiacibacter xanthus]|nr:TolC family protein [Aurantiacibacter xanthus]
MQPASAQDSSWTDAILDLPTAAREAVAWHPTVARAADQLNAQEQRIGEVRSALYPQVTGGVGLGYDSTLRNDWRPSANIGVSQRLLDFGKLDSLTDIERAGVRVARAQVLLSVDTLLHDTAFSVIEILRGEMLHAAASEQVERVRAIGNLVDARAARGAATRSDALQTQSRVDAAQSTIQQIKAELLRWQTNLGFLLGREVAPPVSSTLPESFDNACGANLEALDAPPLMQEARARLDQAEARLRNERVGRMPTISVGGSGRSDLLDPLGEDRARYDFGIRVESSLFDGGAYR